MINKNHRFSEFDISVRLLNCMYAHEITHPIKLTKLKRKDVARFRSFGKKSQMELDDFMKFHGIYFLDEKPKKNINVFQKKLKQETLEEAFEKWSDKQNAYSKLDVLKFGAKWQQEIMYSEEDMIEASKYGYNFHKTTQFPNQEFEDSCIRNTQQWVQNLKTNKI